MGIFRFRRQDSGFLVEKRKGFYGLKQVFNLYDCVFDICLVKFWGWMGDLGVLGAAYLIWRVEIDALYRRGQPDLWKRRVGTKREHRIVEVQPD